MAPSRDQVTDMVSRPYIQQAFAHRKGGHILLKHLPLLQQKHRFALVECTNKLSSEA
jgi:hypothetical protein